MRNTKLNVKILARNKKYHLEYNVLYQLECGIVLTENTIKDLRKYHPSIYDSYGKIINGEIWLQNFNIKNSMHNSIKKLLAHKKEIRKIINYCSTPKVVIIPIEVYEKNGWVKVLIICAEALKKVDKRDRIRKKEERKFDLSD